MVFFMSSQIAESIKNLSNILNNQIYCASSVVFKISIMLQIMLHNHFGNIHKMIASHKKRKILTDFNYP